MNLLYPKIAERKTASARKFDDVFLIFKNNESIPFAYRAPNADAYISACCEQEEMLFDFDRFLLYGSGENICCSYKGSPSLEARILPLSESHGSKERKVEGIKTYLASAYNLDPYTLPRISAISGLEELVSEVADYCGCLTDIYREDKRDGNYAQLPEVAANGGIIAVSLPIIALMYRRISALRGFNFKVSFVDSLPCLGFSAKVLLDGEKPVSGDIPEYAVLKEVADSERLVIAARLMQLPEDEDVKEQIYKLSVVICPQDIDPRGILRAPELLKRKENIIEKFDFDIPGKY